MFAYKGGIWLFKVTRQEDESQLKAAYVAERDGCVKPRLHGLWLIRSGYPVKEAARLVGVNERTVKEWLAWYRQGGLSSVRQRRQGGHGQVCRLTTEQKAALAVWERKRQRQQQHQQQLRRKADSTASAMSAASVEPWTERQRVQEAVAWVEEQWGVIYSESGMRSLLRTLA